jgi:hypothetical protein
MAVLAHLDRQSNSLFWPMIHSYPKPYTENIHSQTNATGARRTQTRHQESPRRICRAYGRSLFKMTSPQQSEDTRFLFGSRDGQGAGDHDQPYRFGWRPRANVPYPFNTRQYARLLVLRGRVQDSLAGGHNLARGAHAPVRSTGQA